MSRLFLAVSGVLLILSMIVLPAAFSGTEVANVQVNSSAQVYFSPNGGATEAIVREIGKAKSEILVQAYSFTSREIARALVDARKRGVRVEIILDKSNRSGKYGAGDFTAHMGIPTYIDDRHAVAHNKVMIIDSETVITGSFNFTRAAEERNAENLVILTSKDLAKLYTENWNRHKGHSQEYLGR